MEIKNIISLIAGIALSVLTNVLVPFIILIILNIFDYFTRIIACVKNEDKLSSSKGIVGIYKKVAMWLAIGVGIVLDILINYECSIYGIPFPFENLLSVTIIMFITVNEVISLMENFKDMGLTIPYFDKVVTWLTTRIGNKSE